MAVRLRYNAPVILSFTLAATALLIADTLAPGELALALAIGPPLNLANPLTYVRLFTHVLGHADWAHLMGNFSFILLIGPILEEKYGSGRILAVIALTALVTGVLAAVVFGKALIGASGVVFALILLGSFTNTRQGDIPLTFILVLVLFVAKEVIDGVTKQDNVAQFAHIAGGVVGGVFGFLATRKMRREAAPPAKPGKGLKDKAAAAGAQTAAGPHTASGAAPAGTETAPK